MPNRGKKNEPSFIKYTAEKLSELKNISKDELIQKTTDNFNKFYKSIMRFTILGCGSSMGVPKPNGDFGNCNPNEKKNFRTRCSAFNFYLKKTY